MDDSELEQIRQARLEQLKSQNGSPGADGNQGEQRQQQEANARKNILDQILQPEAADRLGRIKLVKQERAAEVENRLIMLAQTGQLRSKVTEAQLKEFLEAMTEKKEEEKIVVKHKRWDADDDLDDLLNL